MRLSALNTAEAALRTQEAEPADFQGRVLRELELLEPTSPKAVRAQLAAMLQCMAREESTEEAHAKALKPEKSLTLVSGRLQAWSRLFTLLQKTFNITLEFDSAEVMDSEKRTLPAEAERSMVFRGRAAQQLRSAMQPAEHFERDERCVRGYLAGEFLCAGFVRQPEKEYYLSIDIRDEQQIVRTAELLKRMGVPLKRQDTGRGHGLVTRDSAVIVDILSLLGAHVSRMEMENARIVRQVRGSINRKVNCETANIMKTVAASQKQMEEIHLLRNSSAWESLPESLQQMAILREQYPDCSLQELGQRMNPPVGKSGVNHRLRRLSALARQLQESGKA